MNDKEDCIIIFTAGELANSFPEGRRGLSNSLKSVIMKASEITVSTLQKNMRRFLSSIDTIISASPKDVGGFALDEVEIQAQIDGKGNVGLSGIAGAEFAVQGGIKFVLRKKMYPPTN
ncbi:MAG: hypothetical protein ACFFB3_05570 [Candidatus Hodarchaeota archaeon]